MNITSPFWRIELSSDIDAVYTIKYFQFIDAGGKWYCYVKNCTLTGGSKNFSLISILISKFTSYVNGLNNWLSLYKSSQVRRILSFELA